ncbi:Zinc/iron permease [Sanghuangporus baumii]|uniref:Zinc/iron permease n=1 Tax=Sanghuangporus baumii TaxID=108892 RepID=A0A9Q5I1E4_SANBA|nr:Zinc/iron permease [Sanghuangporus baumii]
MSGTLTILLMSAALGIAAFGIGMLPLFFTFSRTHIQYLSTVGTGLLLGAALGIIIPEGVETLVSSNVSEPSRKIALSLILGFAFMLIVEQLISGHPHDHGGEFKHSPLPTSASLAVPGRTADGRVSPNAEFDISLAELEDAEGIHSNGRDSTEQPILERLGGGGVREGNGSAEVPDKKRAFSMTLGLVIHSLADGLALGASALPRKGDGDSEATQNTQLSLVVFLAIIIHKAPTALALSMSLLSSLTPSECRKHLAAFSAATPIGALVVFAILNILGGDIEGEWTGIALLLSGGTFLYVATVLAPVSKPESSRSSTSSSTEMDERLRIGLILLGMFIPLLIALFTAHEH